MFHVSSRINSTWGGNLVDMVRCQRYLEIIEEEKLVENAADRRARTCCAGSRRCRPSGPTCSSNARGRGLMCAIDFPDGATRDAVRSKAYELGHDHPAAAARGACASARRSTSPRPRSTRRSALLKQAVEATAKKS